MHKLSQKKKISIIAGAFLLLTVVTLVSTGRMSLSGLSSSAITSSNYVCNEKNQTKNLAQYNQIPNNITNANNKISIISGEIRVLQDKINAHNVTIGQKEQKIATRPAEIQRLNALISPITTFINTKCRQPTGTMVRTCNDKKKEKLKYENEISKLNALENDIKKLQGEIGTPENSKSLKGKIQLKENQIGIWQGKINDYAIFKKRYESCDAELKLKPIVVSNLASGELRIISGEIETPCPEKLMSGEVVFLSGDIKAPVMSGEVQVSGEVVVPTILSVAVDKIEFSVSPTPENNFNIKSWLLEFNQYTRATCTSKQKSSNPVEITVTCAFPQTSTGIMVIAPGAQLGFRLIGQLGSVTMPISVNTEFVSLKYNGGRTDVIDQTQPAILSYTSNSCQQNICGNGIKEGAEQCDDGNNVNDDGCNYKCEIERTPDYVSAANKLASLGIIVDHSANPAEYRLSDTIIRQEAIRVAASVFGGILENESSYICTGIFTDISNSIPWVCRVVEISKGAGLVVETGNLFRPTEKLTKIEAITFALRASHIIEGPQTTEQILKIAIDAKLIPSEVGFNSNDIAVRGEFFYYLVQSIEAAKVPDLCTIAPDLCTVSTSCENLQGSQNCLQQNGCYYNEKTSKCTSEALKCEDMSDAQDDIFTKGMIWGFARHVYSPRYYQASYDYCTGEIINQVSCDSEGFAKYTTVTCPNGCSDGACKPADPVVEVCEDLTVTPSMTQGGGIVSYTCQSNMDILCILDPNFCKPKTFSVVLKNPAGIVVQTMTTANGIFSIPTTPTGTYTAECFVNGQTTTIAACKKPITITAVTTNPDQEENGNDDHFVSSPIYTALLDNTTGLVYGQDTNLMKLDIAANNKYDILLKTIPINMQIYTKNLNVSNIKLRDKNGNILGVTMTAINKVNEFNKDVQLVITFNDPYAIPAGTGTDFILTGVVMGQSNEYDTVSTWLGDKEKFTGVNVTLQKPFTGEDISGYSWNAISLMRR